MIVTPPIGTEQSVSLILKYKQLSNNPNLNIQTYHFTKFHCKSLCCFLYVLKLTAISEDENQSHFYLSFSSPPHPSSENVWSGQPSIHSKSPFLKKAPYRTIHFLVLCGNRFPKKFKLDVIPSFTNRDVTNISQGTKTVLEK